MRYDNILGKIKIEMTERSLDRFMWTSPSLAAERMERGNREGMRFIKARQEVLEEVTCLA